ncbi:hypothetical protein GJ496_007167 [Pomphorhynchus laevis]|nr:hypothetical protein GJ496_007167 [Pomphorhynchus laevis]
MISTYTASMNDYDTILKIEDDFNGWDPNSFDIPFNYKQFVNRVLIPRGLIDEQVQRIAGQIFYDYTYSNSVNNTSCDTTSNDLNVNGSPSHSSCHRSRLQLVCILKGASIFFHQLFDELQQIKRSHLRTVLPSQYLEISLHYLRTRSYRGTISIGTVEMNLDNIFKELDPSQPILLVEDIIDTGRTLSNLLSQFNKFSKKIKIVSLCKKRLRKSPEHDIQPNYCCFSIPDRYIIGYGFDIDDRFRDMDHICTTTKE